MGFNKKNLAAGIREMRSVARRLTAWADDLEKFGELKEEDTGQADGSVPAVADAPGCGPALAPAEALTDDLPAKAQTETVSTEITTESSPEPAPTEPEPTPPPTLSEVKAYLTKLCAAGYAPQVKALIASFGAASLSGVPAESLGDLFDAALLLGEEGGSADAG